MISVIVLHFFIDIPLMSCVSKLQHSEKEDYIVASCWKGDRRNQSFGRGVYRIGAC
jgi:hypothetical protein